MIVADEVRSCLILALQRMYAERVIPEDLSSECVLERPKDLSHGDFACTLALSAAKRFKMAPIEFAQHLVRCLPESSWIEAVSIAGPGFINLRLGRLAYVRVLESILSSPSYGQAPRLGQRCLVEFVSSNPTGPLHVGHGRAAALGAILVNVLRAAGYTVDTEYYVNDAGRQVMILMLAVWLRYWEQSGQSFEYPRQIYQGDYVRDLARMLSDRLMDWGSWPQTFFDDLPSEPEEATDAMILRMQKAVPPSGLQAIRRWVLDAMIEDMRQDLEAMGVSFDRWFSEQSLLDSGALEALVERLKSSDQAYQRDGAIWFRSTDYGDDKDRVMLRANGQPTYFANDFAYHADKWARGYDHIIDVLGADHHGYFSRIAAALAALGAPSSVFKVVGYQMVNLFRGTERLNMSTRAGTFVPLRTLREEVGVDAMRVFFISRRQDQPIDFDLDLAKKSSQDNPVYYLQYAYARICSVFRQLSDKGYALGAFDGAIATKVLDSDLERQVVLMLAQYPSTIVSSARQYEPFIILSYLQDLAALFHRYYAHTHFLVEDEGLRNARLGVLMAVQRVMAHGMDLLGVSKKEIL